jgi:hypothetical protein
MSAIGVELLAESLASLVTVDPDTLDDAAVRESTLVLLRCTNQLDAVMARFLGAFDDRKLSPKDGYGTTKQWLQAYGRLSGPAATGRMRAVAVTRLLPSLEEAFGAGEVTREHVDRIGLTAQDVGDEVVEGAEEPLVMLARGYEPETLNEACARLLDEVLRDKRTPPDEQYRRRGMTLARVGEMWKLRGVLDAETGLLLTTAVDAFTTPPTLGDDRSPAQRRHDALADLLNTILREGRAPVVAGVRPHLGLLMPVKRYAELHDHGTAAGDGAVVEGEVVLENGPALLTGWGPIPDAFAARLSCDANLQQVWQHPDNGMPLQLGRAYRNTPPALRRALATRDPYCRWPGCRIPASWCDSHHLREWVRDNGNTDVDNLVILCRYHHVCAHERGWGLHRDPATGWITITRPDGSPYELGPSRPRTGSFPHDFGVDLG